MLREEGRKLRQMAKEGLPLPVGVPPTERTAANRYYADNAREVLPKLSKGLSIPDDPVLAARIRVGIDWILGRTTVLSELGRMMVEKPGEEDIACFHSAVRYVAERHHKMSAKDAAAYVRRVRLGETGRRDRLKALHHDLNATINHHRRRFPESSWADVLTALEHAEKQIRKKVR